MRIDRRDLKWRARDAMRAACPNALFMTFLYLLLTSGLPSVVSWFVADPLGDVMHLYQQGITLDRALPLMLRMVGRMGLFLNILMAICGVVIDFGYRIWCLNTARGEQGAIGDLFDGFSMVGRILWLRVLILVYGFLWSLAIFMPALLGVLIGGLVPLIGPLISVAVFVLAVVACLSRVLRYSMADYCLADEPEMGASWALRRSRRMMEGRVKDYVVLLLSFLGWFVAMGLIVAALESVLFVVASMLHGGAAPQAETGGVVWLLVSVLPTLASLPLGLWLKPYMTITECNFYEKIKGGAESANA